MFYVKPKDKEWRCPDCGELAEYIGFQYEEVPIPKSDWGKPLKRIPTLQAVARNFLVRCPTHEEKIVQKFGHHITSIPKKPK
jgi:hypothetical protein